jgi:hypothetical protein
VRTKWKGSICDAVHAQDVISAGIRSRQLVETELVMISYLCIDEPALLVEILLQNETTV